MDIMNTKKIMKKNSIKLKIVYILNLKKLQRKHPIMMAKFFLKKEIFFIKLYSFNINLEKFLEYLFSMEFKNQKIVWYLFIKIMILFLLEKLE